MLAPYQLVSDHRTEKKVSQVNEVLDGALDEFMIAHLLQLAGDNSVVASNVSPTAKKPDPDDDL